MPVSPSHDAGMKRLCLLPVLVCAPAMADDAPMTPGQKAAVSHCGRCHVVPGGNPYGSIGSTPSFAVMRHYKDWKARFEAFYTEPPHPAITQIEGVTDPFDPARPSPIAPMILTEAELKAIIEFVETIEPKDVGVQQE